MGLLDRFKKDSREQTAPQTAKSLVSKKKQSDKKVEKTENVETNSVVKEIKKEQNNKKSVTKESSLYQVLVRPLVSEKAAAEESRGVYSFVVDKDANKFQIKEAIAAIYKVRPTRVRVININGKFVRQGRSYGRRSDWKKAVVTLPKGQSINIHEGV